MFKDSGGHLLNVLKWVEINESMQLFITFYLPSGELMKFASDHPAWVSSLFIVACRRKKLSHVDYPGMSLIRNALRALLKKCILSFFVVGSPSHNASTFIRRTNLARADISTRHFFHCPWLSSLQLDYVHLWFSFKISRWCWWSHFIRILSAQLYRQHQIYIETITRSTRMCLWRAGVRKQVLLSVYEKTEQRI